MGEVADWSVRVSNPGGDWVALGVGAMLLAVALLGLREAARVADPRRRGVLRVLRIVSAVLALLIGLQPQWVGARVQSVPGKLAVLVDTSRSMGIRESGGVTRAERTREVLERWLEGPLTPALYAFGAEASPITAGDLYERGAVADDTRIGHALEQVAREQGDDLGAVVLLSDGADLSPAWSPARLGGLGVRVHAVAVGEGRDLVDDAILEVKADPVAFLRQEGQVQVMVRSAGRDQSEVAVTLRRDGQLVSERIAALDDSGVGTVVLPLSPEALGRAVYTVSIPVATEDSVVENNERAFLVRVVRDKLRVLLICGAPSWDTRFLRAFLKADPSIDLITFFILRTSNDLTLAPPEELSLIPFPTDELFREHLESFDLVIFQDFNYGPYQMQKYLPRVRDYVLQGGAFAMVGGSRAFGAGGYHHTPIAQVLPVEMVPGERAVNEEPFSPQLVPDAARHPIVELLPEPSDNAEAWASLAPLIGANLVAGLRGDGKALLSHPALDRGDGPMPVLAVGTAGSGRVLALMADTSWRWGMATAEKRGDASGYERFWDRALRWLARDPLLEPSRVELDRERYGPASTVRVELRARDATYNPLREHALAVRLLTVGGEVVSLHQVETDAEGRAELSLPAPGDPGGYNVQASLHERGDVLADEGFVVETGGDELADPRARPDLLAAIAEATGGRYVAPGRTPPDLEALDRSRTRALGSVVRAPFSGVVFFILFVALLALEWGLRRAWGLR